VVFALERDVSNAAGAQKPRWIVISLLDRYLLGLRQPERLRSPPRDSLTNLSGNPGLAHSVPGFPIDDYLKTFGLHRPLLNHATSPEAWHIEAIP
jgi:hypothetical protein